MQPIPVYQPPLRYNNFYANEVRSSKVVEILCWFKDYLLAAIQNIFRKCISQHVTYTDQLSADHLAIYIDQFNQEDHEALISSPHFSMLRINGDWSKADERENAPLLERMVNDLKVNYFKVKAEEVDQHPLRQLMVQKNKKILAMMINIENCHWTTIHFNFENKTITYVDSIVHNSPIDRLCHALQGPSPIERLIEAKLAQTLQWIREKDQDPTWSITPPAIKRNLQWNQWDCGVFAIHLTFLASKEKKSYEEISATPFLEMRKQIRARRLDIMEYVENSFLENPDYNLVKEFL